MPNKYHLKIERCHKYFVFKKLFLNEILKHISISIFHKTNVPDGEEIRSGRADVDQTIPSVSKANTSCVKLCTISYRLISFSRDENISSACLNFGFAAKIDTRLS